MEASVLLDTMKKLGEANTAGKTADVERLLKSLKEVTPTEELLRTSKAGVAVGKLRNHENSTISSLAKDLVKQWKDTIEAEKKKRKRGDGDAGGAGGDGKKGGSGGGVAAVDGKSPEGREVIIKKLKTEAASPKPPTTDIKLEKKPSKESIKEDSEGPRPLTTIDSTLETPRTAKSDNIIQKLKPEDDGAESIRVNSIIAVYNALAGDSNAQSKIIVERAVGIEAACYELFKSDSGNDYRAKMRSLMLNIKEKTNSALRNEIVLGYLAPEVLVRMGKDELASESVRTMNQKIASENLFKAKAVGETQAETDAFKCGRCQQRKCTYYQMQTRSADEPMTTFVTCTNCGNRWKFS